MSESKMGDIVLGIVVGGVLAGGVLALMVISWLLGSSQVPFVLGLLVVLGVALLFPRSASAARIAVAAALTFALLLGILT